MIAAVEPQPWRVASIETPAPDVRIVRLAPDDGAPFPWRAGQYASIAVDGFEPRDYSIANPSGGDALELHVRPGSPGGLGEHLCRHLDIGDTVTVAGPFGAAYYRDRHEGPLLAIAGGTGLAQMKAIVETALQDGFRQDIHLYVGVRTEDDLYLERYFIGLTHDYPNFRFVTVIAEPRENSGRRSGLVGEAVAADFQLLYGHQCYLSGPPAMVDACRAMLKLKAVPPHDIFTDAAYAVPVPR